MIRQQKCKDHTGAKCACRVVLQSILGWHLGDGARRSRARAAAYLMQVEPARDGRECGCWSVEAGQPASISEKEAHRLGSRFVGPACQITSSL